MDEESPRTLRVAGLGILGICQTYVLYQFNYWMSLRYIHIEIV